MSNTPDFVTFRTFVQEELDYLLDIELNADPLRLRAAGALMTVRDYLDICISIEENKHLTGPDPAEVIRSIAEHVHATLETPPNV